MISLSRRATVVGLLACTATPARAAEPPARLRIGLLPTESAPTVIRLNEPLRAYLEKRLSLQVELVVGTALRAKDDDSSTLDQQGPI